MSHSQPNNEFPISKKSKVKGTRHLAREKVLQILAATNSGDVATTVAFDHVFYREFTFDSKESTSGDRILHPDEVMELEADVPIRWSEDEISYAHAVVSAADTQLEMSTELIKKHAQNWDYDRIAVLDIILMRLAIAELTSCSEIPVKVTINEVIELAKRYSTDKSGTFINGILDAIIEELQSNHLITKTGRGLQP